MAVLGTGGVLYLRRDAPDPCLIDGAALDNGHNSLVANCSNFWTGDHVVTSNLPVLHGLYPPNPQGWSSYYDGKWFLGPNRSHITSADHAFYKDALEEYPDGQFGDDAQFYARVGDVADGDEIVSGGDDDFWIHIDQLGRISFYRSRCEALSGCAAGRVELEGPVAGMIGIAPYGSTDYNNAVWECLAEFAEYRQADVQDTITLDSICEFVPDYQQPVANDEEYDNADLVPRGINAGQAWPYWQIVCDLREWTLELSAPSVDTTAISEKFGEAVKSLVTGGGATEFLIDRKCYDDNQDNGIMLMKLLMMTEKGCKASARFFLVDRSEEGCGPMCNAQIAGDLYYEADLLVTASAVNVRPTEILAGTANFVTTGEIRLLEAP